MTIRVRTFQNLDIHHLAPIWNRHHELAGFNDSCPSTVWDFCVLSKPFFDADLFLIAFREEEPVGFLHGALAGSKDLSDQQEEVCLVNALCLLDDEEEDQIAHLLLERFRSLPIVQRAGTKLATGSPLHFAFYLGISPTDGMLGVPSKDLRLQSWLEKDRFQPWAATSLWELDVQAFRPPMDRSQIQVRRQYQVARVLEGGPLPWWLACCLGHAEQFHFQLCSRNPVKIHREITFWQFDPTIDGLRSSSYLMILGDLSGDSEKRDQSVFLLSESIRQLQQDRVESLRTIVLSEQIATTEVLQRLGFRCRETGIVYQAQA